MLYLLFSISLSYINSFYRHTVDLYSDYTVNHVIKVVSCRNIKKSLMSLKIDVREGNEASQTMLTLALFSG